MESKTSRLYWLNVITILGLIIAAVIAIPFQQIYQNNRLLFWEIVLILILLLFLVIEIYSSKIKSTHEFEIIQTQVSEVKQFFKDFSFVTLYRENSNRGFIDIPSNPNIISNKDYDAVNKFIRYVKKILTNNLTSTHRGPLSNDSFNKCFPPDSLKIVNDIKRILDKFIKIVTFIKNSNSYKQNSENIIHIMNVLKVDIQESLLNHEGMLSQITDDLFPQVIKLCNERKVIPINNLTTFLEGLIEIKSKFIEVKNSINGDIAKVNGNPAPGH